jgi:small subunit ribosomal protein S20
MPNTKGARKRLRQSVVRRDRNRAQKTRFRHCLRKFREAVAAHNVDDAKMLSKETARLLDKAAAKGVIHRNKAARLKSRMSHLIVVAQQHAA